MKKFDAEVCMTQYGGKCVTRDGREVRILATDATRTEYPIVGLIKGADGVEFAEMWTSSGCVYSSGSETEDDIFLEFDPEEA